MATFLDGVSWDTYVGVTTPGFAGDLGLGLLTGFSCVVVMFAGGVGLGWLRVVGFGQVLVPGESLPLNLLWDVIFHVAVSLNEEVALRGWLLPNVALAIVAHLGWSPGMACICAVAAESAYFSYMHWGSPGITRQGMINLTIGGVAAALNVVLSGGLGFALGWHFAWNIWMGHLLGLSTSGIPMSATLVEVVPHPTKESLHGGRFGPEGGPLAPIAYGVGVAMLVAFYSMEGLDKWLGGLAQVPR